MVGKLSLYMKAVNSIDDSDVRISKRAKMPYNRLRGFEREKIGPKDGEDYIGGNYTTALNLEANFPNFFPEKSNAEIGLFFDAGFKTIVFNE